MRVRLAAALVLLAGCGGSGSGGGGTASAGGASGAGSVSYDIAPVFRQGHVYSVRTETGSKIATPTASSEAVVVMESTREISAGGEFRGGPLRWRETVQRIEITGDQSWNSSGDQPPPEDLLQVAALAGSSYTVDIDARGIAEVSSLDLPMPKLTEEQRGQVRDNMGDAEKVASSLAASVVTSLSSMPNRKTRVGETWTHEARNPSLGPDARVVMKWTLREVEDSLARFEVEGKYRSDALDSGEVEGSATFDLDERHFKQLSMTTELFLANGAGQVTTTNEVQVSVTGAEQ